MSAPDTNIERQTRQHRSPLVGIAIAIGFTVIVAAGVAMWRGVPLDEQAAPDRALDAPAEIGASG
jgi:hypothetical protein